MSWLVRLLTRRRTAIPPAERLENEWERINLRLLARDAEGDPLDPEDLDAGIPAVASNAPAVGSAGAPVPDGTSHAGPDAAPEPRPGSPSYGLDSLPGPRGGTPSNNQTRRKTIQVVGDTCERERVMSRPPDRCKTCSERSGTWVRWQGHTFREARLIASLTAHPQPNNRWEGALDG